jgi:glycosyltransferase involved in cell wall biosynthesis
MVSTIYHATPPSGYGGIERVVYRLTEQLIKEGHEVVLFGAKGSSCSGKTVAIDAYDPDKAPSGIRRGKDILTEEPLYEAMVAHFEKNPVDVIHDFSFQNLYVLRHPEKFPFVISTCIPPAQNYQRPNLVACSRAHAALCGPTTKFVHYGLNLTEWKFCPQKTKPMIHISKVTKYKAQHLAIDAAKKAQQELWIAGNIEDPKYFYAAIVPRLWFAKGIKYIGEIDGTQAHLKDAKALIQTPQWFDAFPLVVLEALACGTPVIGFDIGGLSEQIQDGVNGFLCHTSEDLVKAMEDIDKIKPRDCRAYAEKHFTIERMTADYFGLYKNVIGGGRW